MPDLAGRHGSRRRTINQINMVPFIDVMLVLLIIFMVAAPLITTGQIDLPSVGKAKQKPKSVIELIITTDERVRLKLENAEPVPIPKAQVAARVKEAQHGDADMPVVISADKGVKYEAVVDVMRMLNEAQVARVGLTVKQTQ